MKILNCEEVNVGDFVKIEFTDGDRMKGGRISGKIKAISVPHRQVELDSGWCGHDGDVLLEHQAL